LFSFFPTILSIHHTLLGVRYYSLASQPSTSSPTLIPTQSASI
jgi:hypothetical protein